MNKPNVNELKLHLTEDQKKEIVRFISETGDSNLHINIVFEASADQKGIAPASVLVGNAI